MTVGDLIAALDAQFPFASAGEWDPVGLQIGGAGRSVDRVGVCHEVTTAVAEAVIDGEIDCLVAYHPLLFIPSTSLIDGPSAEGLALALAENGTSLVVVHTALDVAVPGSADALLAGLGLSAERTFAPVDDLGGGDIGRIGRFDEPISFDELVSRTSDVVGSPVRASVAHPDSVETIAVVPGSGGGFVRAAIGLADVYVSGDIGHHDANHAAARGLGVIDAGHAPTERPGVRALYDAVCEASPSATMLDDDPHPWEG